MKKQLLSLLMVPALLLCSCKGSKISEEKAKELAEKISANRETIPENSKSSEIILEYKVAEGKGEERKSADIKFEFTQDVDENLKLKVKGTDDENKNYDFVLYKVKNEAYEEVSYVKEYDQEAKKYTETVYLKKDNADYTNVVGSYTIIALVPVFFLVGFTDPVETMKAEAFTAGEIEKEGLTYNNDVNYYSSGDKNLTMESNIKLVKGEVPEDKEVNLNQSYSVTYDNLFLKKIIMSGKSNYGNKMAVNASISLSSKAVALPSGWEKLIEQA